MLPRSTRYTVSDVQDIKLAFEFYITPLIEKDILEGRRLFGRSLKDLTHLQVYIGLLILAAKCKCWHWKGNISSHHVSKDIPCFSHAIHFNDREKSQGQWDCDKLTVIWDIWNLWVQWLLFLDIPGPHMTVDECLVGSHGHCPFRQYITRKPAKCGIIIWVACDA